MVNKIEAILSEFYTLGDAAKALGISRVTLWRWIRDGKLKGYRIGRQVLVEKKSIDTAKIA